MKNPFIKFEKFGAVCDFETRKKIAQSIFNKLLTGIEADENKDFLLTDSETENYASTIEIILANETLREMTRNNPELAETTAQEILNFIHSTKRAIVGFGNPYQEEVMLADSFTYAKPSEHKSYWKLISAFLAETYDKKELNPDFYTKAFNKFFKGVDENQSYESIRDHLIEKWRELILLKLTAFQEQKMEEFVAEFTKELFEKMLGYQDMATAMHDFATDFNEIFDMPEGGFSEKNLKTLKKYHEMLEMNEAVKELVQMLGRMKLSDEDEEKGTQGTSDDKYEWEANHAGKADLIGVKESDDLSNLLPSETALLSDPALQVLFLKRYAEKKLQTFDFEDRLKSFKADPNKKGTRKGKESEKGPYIICVDTSGSMMGQPEKIAKTICLALLKVALKEKRNCYLITFSVGVVTLDLTDLKNNMEKIVDFLALSFHGGTDASPALAEAVTMLKSESFKNADVLMISDFEMPRIQPSVLERMDEARKEKTKFHSLIIGGYWHYHYGYANQRVVDNFDHVWCHDPKDERGIFKLLDDLS